jgi:hypothetical protein
MFMVRAPSRRSEILGVGVFVPARESKCVDRVRGDDRCPVGEERDEIRPPEAQDDAGRVADEREGDRFYQKRGENREPGWLRLNDRLRDR